MTSRPTVVLVDGHSVQRRDGNRRGWGNQGAARRALPELRSSQGPGVIRVFGIHGFKRARRSESNQLATKSEGETR
jgi:hypothetical protein